MSKLQLAAARTALLGLTLFAAACGSKGKDEPQPETLYSRMGGSVGVTAVVDQHLANVGAETGVANSVMLRSHVPLLEAINGKNGAAPTDPGRFDRLRNNVVDQFINITGGPNSYRGKNMLLAHTGMAVTENEYTVWRGILVKSLTEKNIPATEQAEFMKLIDAMKADVVNH